MAKIVISPPELTLQRVRVIEFPPSPEQSSELERPVGTRESPQVSWLGTHVIDNLRFEPGAYTDRDGNQVNYGGLTLDTMIMRVMQSKVIISTQVAGRPGTVKEYISDADYEVAIIGALIGKNAYPAEAVERLVELCKVPASLEVVSPFLQIWDINELVIKDFTFNQTPGYEKQQNFEIRAISDNPIELQLIDNAGT